MIINNNNNNNNGGCIFYSNNITKTVSAKEKKYTTVVVRRNAATAYTPLVYSIVYYGALHVYYIYRIMYTYGGEVFLSDREGVIIEGWW